MVIDAAGSALDHGKGKIARAKKPGYTASQMGDCDDAIARVVLPDAQGHGRHSSSPPQRQRGARHVAGFERRNVGWRGASDARSFQSRLQESRDAKCK